jgi:hypothetical protein
MAWITVPPKKPDRRVAKPSPDSRANDGGRHALLLEGYGYRWYRVGGLDYLLKRSDIDTDATGKTSHSA